MQMNPFFEVMRRVAMALAVSNNNNPAMRH
jgi:hypothetical protein